MDTSLSETIHVGIFAAPGNTNPHPVQVPLAVPQDKSGDGKTTATPTLPTSSHELKVGAPLVNNTPFNHNNEANLRNQWPNSLSSIQGQILLGNASERTNEIIHYNTMLQYVLQMKTNEVEHLQTVVVATNALHLTETNRRIQLTEKLTDIKLRFSTLQLEKNRAKKGAEQS